MSMLAEPRRKVRYNINPNGNTWANDSSAFGKKMLEKMGWSNGKGLGANLDGMTTHVKVSYKCDQEGVGFKDKNDQWTEHEDNFTALLQNLQSDGHQAIEAEVMADDEKSGPGRKSLELKSKTSRARVHYKKFTRGKDLSRYSSKDLANIFGRATLEKKAKEEVQVEAAEETNDNDSSEGADNKNKSFGVETLQGGSMADYFKKKMSQFKSNFGAKTRNEDESDDFEVRPAFGFGFSGRESPEPERGGFGFGFVAAGEKSEESEKIEEGEGEITKKQKKRKRQVADNDDVQEGKKKPKKDVASVPSGLANPGFEKFEDNCDSGVSLDENPFEMKAKVKKCKKSKNKTPHQVEEVENDLESEVKKKKKKKRSTDQSEQGLENPNFNDSLVNNEETSILETPVNPYEVVVKDKKKTKKKKHETGVENPVFEESLLLEEDLTSKKKKKKQKLDDESFTIEEIEETTAEVPKVSKKKKKKTQDENEVEIDVTEESTVTEQVRKKKKKKNKVSITKDDSPSSTFASKSSSEGDSPARGPNVGLGSRSNAIQGQPVDVDVDLGVSSVSNNFGITDDLIMNISSTDPKPILHTPQNAHARVKRRKSVRIDESLNQQHIIPNILQQKQMELEPDSFNVHETHGVANEGFDLHSKDQGFYEHDLEVTTKSKKKPATSGISNPGFRDVQGEVAKCMNNLVMCQAEVENDINENKVMNVDDSCKETKYIGTVAKLEENRTLSNGHVQLAFKNSQLTQSLSYYDRQTQDIAKKGYRHLVKGDVEVQFPATNLHQIIGYATTESLTLRKKLKGKAVLQEENGTVLPVAPPREHVTNMEMVMKLQGRMAKKYNSKGYAKKGPKQRKSL